MKSPFVKLKPADFLALTLLHLKNVYFLGVFARIYGAKLLNLDQ